jgi:hypothetical protein
LEGLVISQTLVVKHLKQMKRKIATELGLYSFIFFISKYVVIERHSWSMRNALELVRKAI